VRQAGDRGLGFRQINGERAVRPHGDATAIHQVIELNRNSPPMRFVDAEANRPEG
jgi:hypothetical protein